MGWISDRAHTRGTSLYSGGPKRKGPLKLVVGIIAGDSGTNLFGSDVALLECGHIIHSTYGGKRAICEKCKAGKPADTGEDWGIDVAATLKKWQSNNLKKV